MFYNCASISTESIIKTKFNLSILKGISGHIDLNMFRRALHLSHYKIYLIFLFCCITARINALQQCYGDNNSQIKTCQWLPSQQLCLVCTVSQDPDVKWYMEETIIANGPLYLGDMEGTSVNKCHRENSSLLLETCEREIIGTIRCEKQSYVLMKFDVQCLLKGNII